MWIGIVAAAQAPAAAVAEAAEHEWLAERLPPRRHTPPGEARLRLAAEIERKFPSTISPSDDGELAEVHAVLEPGVTIDMKERGCLSGTGRLGPRCLIIDADEPATAKFELCDGNDALPSGRPVDLHAKGACPRSAMSGGEFPVAMKGPSGTWVDGDSLAFLDSAPGAYVVRPVGGKLQLEFRPEPELCRVGPP